MRHRLLFGLAASMMAALMCVGFAACGRVDAKTFAGEEITEEQWNDAVRLLQNEETRFTIEAQATSNGTVEADLTPNGGSKLSGDVSSTGTWSYVRNGNKEYTKQVEDVTFSGDAKRIYEVFGPIVDMKEGRTEEERYTEKNDSVYTLYYRDDNGNWKKRRGVSSQNMLAGILKVTDYNRYEYSTEQKGYVLKDAGEDKLLVLKFDKNARLSAVYYVATEEPFQSGVEIRLTGEMKFLITYDAGEINLPKVEE